MEAKDTVMDYDGKEVGIILREFPDEAVSDALVDKLLQLQAEISFKAGQEAVILESKMGTLTVSSLVNRSRREVVEWLIERNKSIYGGLFLEVDGLDWNAKLKEWGVK